MKVYNLTSGTLHIEHDGEDHFCALGIFAAERGCPVEELTEDDYSFFEKPGYQEDLDRMGEFLAEAAGLSPGGVGQKFSLVHYANDARDWEGWNSKDGIKALPFRVPVEKIREALALAGIKVELKDKRGQW